MVDLQQELKEFFKEEVSAINLTSPVSDKKILGQACFF